MSETNNRNRVVKKSAARRRLRPLLRLIGRTKWDVSSDGLPVIESWQQLAKVDDLPERIVWAADGKRMGLVAAGIFLMGCPEEEPRKLARQWNQTLESALAETPQRSLHLSSFYIDVTPVTHADFAQFIEANRGYPLPSGSENWSPPYSWDRDRRQPLAELRQHPVVLVSFDDARAYASWAGKRLPSEAQWEKAARGPDGIRYPWGDQFDADRLQSADRIAGRPLNNFDEWKDWWFAHLKRRVVSTAAVGQFAAGASPYGILDMAGNVGEWCDDWFRGYPGTEVENEAFGNSRRVVPGGSWLSASCNVRASHRSNFPPSVKVIYIGFRCASPCF